MLLSPANAHYSKFEFWPTVERQVMSHFGVSAMTPKWLGSAICLAACAFSCGLAHADDAKAVALKAVEAFSAHDADALIKLTLPEECTKCHITAAAVRGVLNETAYANKTKVKYTLDLTGTNLAEDQVLLYFKAVGKDKSNTRYPLPVILTRDKTGKVYLATSYLLFSTCATPSAPNDTMSQGKRFTALADKYGIIGIRTNATGYTFRKHKKG
jgi:hypothetical protein